MANQTVGIHSVGTAIAEEGMKEAGNSKILLPRRVGGRRGVKRSDGKEVTFELEAQE